MSKLEEYWKLREQSNAAHRRAYAEIVDYTRYSALVAESWRLADLAQAIMDTLPDLQQQEIRKQTWESMCEGYTKALLGKR